MTQGVLAAINPYEATVAGEAGEPRPAVINEAIRQVAVRATGRRAAATDPALAGLYANARQYVQTLTPAGPGLVTLGFDASLIESALAKAGQPLWSGERPAILVLLASAATGAAVEPASTADMRRALERVAMGRGVSLVFARRAPADIAAWHAEEIKRADPASLAELAAHYGAGEVLLGLQNAAEWRWLASGRVSVNSLAAAAEEALQVCIDRLASEQSLAPGSELSAVTVEVRGIMDARGYAAATRALTALPSVRSVVLLEADRDQVQLAVSLRGGVDALRRALVGSQVLVADTSAGPALQLRLKP